MAGRTMVHQINTPTKYSVIHANNAAGLFASYNRSIPKTNGAQNNRIWINDFGGKKIINKANSKIRKKKATDQKPNAKKQLRSLRDGSPEEESNYHDNQANNNPGTRERDKILVKKIWKNKPIGISKHINVTQVPSDDKTEISDFRVRSASSSKKYRYSKEESKDYFS